MLRHRSFPLEDLLPSPFHRAMSASMYPLRRTSLRRHNTRDCTICCRVGVARNDVRTPPLIHKLPTWWQCVRLETRTSCNPTDANIQAHGIAAANVVANRFRVSASGRAIARQKASSAFLFARFRTLSPSVNGCSGLLLIRGRIWPVFQHT